MKTYIHTKSCKQMFIAANLIINSQKLETDHILLKSYAVK